MSLAVMLRRYLDHSIHFDSSKPIRDSNPVRETTKQEYHRSHLAHTHTRTHSVMFFLFVSSVPPSCLSPIHSVCLVVDPSRAAQSTSASARRGEKTTSGKEGGWQTNNTKAERKRKKHSLKHRCVQNRRRDRERESVREAVGSAQWRRGTSTKRVSPTHIAHVFPCCMLSELRP